MNAAAGGRARVETTAGAGPTAGLRLAGILGLLLLVRLIALHLNRTDLFFDEAQYWSWAK